MMSTVNRVHTWIAGAALALLAMAPTPARGDAHCWAKILCSFPGGSTFTGTPSWSNGSWPFSSAEWATCRTNCNNYLFGLDLQGLAEERNVCGTVECTAIHWLGTRPERACEGRNVQVACPDPATSGTNAKSALQYAAKIACGPAVNHPIVEDSDYKTTVNIHNPQYQNVPFRHKVAVAGPRVDGRISDFVWGSIGSDGAQEFDCEYVRTLLGSPPGLIDGFLIIESTLPLDVIGYYTAGNTPRGVPAIHVEKYPARTVAAHDPRCRPELSIDLADAKNWLKADGNMAAVFTGQTIWDLSRPWIAYSNTGADGTDRDFTYQLDFCACSGGTVQATGNVKSDNAARGELNTLNPNNQPQTTQLFDTGVPFPSGSGNFHTTDQAVVISTTPVNVAAGTGNIVVTVHNATGPSGVSVVGSLTLRDAYVGACRK